MKWQTLLTKSQLAHLRWSVNGDTPTLARFKFLREEQAVMNAVRRNSGLNSDVCHDCFMIEARLKAGGKL